MCARHAAGSKASSPPSWSLQASGDAVDKSTNYSEEGHTLRGRYTVLKDYISEGSNVV